MNFYMNPSIKDHIATTTGELEGTTLTLEPGDSVELVAAYPVQITTEWPDEGQTNVKRLPAGETMSGNAQTLQRLRVSYPTNPVLAGLPGGIYVTSITPLPFPPVPVPFTEKGAQLLPFMQSPPVQEEITEEITEEIPINGEIEEPPMNAPPMPNDYGIGEPVDDEREPSDTGWGEQPGY